MPILQPSIPYTQNIFHTLYSPLINRSEPLILIDHILKLLFVLLIPLIQLLYLMFLNFQHYSIIL